MFVLASQGDEKGEIGEPGFNLESKIWKNILSCPSLTKRVLRALVSLVLKLGGLVRTKSTLSPKSGDGSSGTKTIS